MHFKVELPDWVLEESAKLPEVMPTLESQMEAVIRFSKLNYEKDTGGPFAAGIFEKETGKRVVIGVNRVVPGNNSTAHAEIVTIAMAQAMLKTFDLGGPEMPNYRLVVNARPCAMCFGSIPWSGVRSLAFAACGEEVEKITGFDEGPIHPQWQQELRNRDIEVIEHVMAEQAYEVFREFANSGSPIYNGRGGDS
ncbi:nucleoside deaminase [Mariniblastus fucicola]|uniref:Guanine deaminase n=1 Tax=Mariniblastus fucicola TaxID=980251 RepID=A0A5B9PCM8_9BACT|nr:nucleoside deaminase [Mariniblastus fucicola]QEG24497.1 Guanine deaminase [Mariniblastus fucicola]